MIDIAKKRWFQLSGILVFVAAIILIPRIWSGKVNPEVVNTVLEVDGRPITALEFQVALNRRLLRLYSVYGRVSSAEQETIMLSVIKEMINDKILEITADREGITVTASDIADKKQKLIRMLDMQADQNTREGGQRKIPAIELYNHFWNTLGFRTENEFLETMKYEIFEEKLSSHLFPEDSFSVSKQELYDSIPRVQLAQIFFVYNRNAPQDLSSDSAPDRTIYKENLDNMNEKQMKMAWDVYRQLKNGADFAEMAKQHSQEYFAASGGDIGWVSKRMVIDEFWQVASQLQPGDITEPFETSLGIHILKCIDRREPDDERFTDYYRFLEKSILVRKRKAAFVGWFYKRFRELEEADKITLFHPVLKANKLRNMGMYQEAIDEYKKAIVQFEDQAPYYHIDIAWILARMKRYSEALRELRIATEKAPNDPQVYFMLGEAYMEVGEHEKALMEFQKASDLATLNYRLHEKLMQIYTQLGLTEEAKMEQQKMQHAIELLSGGKNEWAPGAMFKDPEFTLPEGVVPDDSIPSVREDSGIPDLDGMALPDSEDQGGTQ